MAVLISDANILIDVSVGELVREMFGLPYQFVVPDVLFFEELETRHGTLLDYGLGIATLGPAGVGLVAELSQRHQRPGRNDLFALALAVQEECLLPTGDIDLRRAAESEGVTVRGTIWLLTEMVRHHRMTVDLGIAALELMRTNGRRLPWQLAATALRESSPG